MNTAGSTTIQVLHVDDEPALADTTATFLEREDQRFEVETATDAGEGLDRLATHDVDCIVSDYDMPGQNGIEFLQTVREEYPNLPFILSTGKGNENVASDAISAGATDYLQKQSGTDQYKILANRITNAYESYRAKQDLVETSERYETILSNLSETVFVTDDEGTFTYVCTNIRYVFGYSDAEVKAFGGVDALFDEQLFDQEKLRADGEISNMETEITHKSGERLTVLVTVKQVSLQNGTRLYTVHDITDRKERERRYSAVFDQTYQFTGLLEPDGTLIEANETALSFGGLDRDDVVGEKLWDAYWVQHSEETRQRVRNAVERASDGEFVRDELSIQGADRNAVIDFSLRPVTDDQGNVTLLIPEGRDITDRKQYEQSLSALYEATTEFVGATTKPEAVEHILSAMSDAAGLPNAAVYFYDDDEGVLSPEAKSSDTAELIGILPTVGPGEGVAWRVFASGETVLYDDIREAEDVYNAETPVRSELIVPLGEHGVLIAGDPRPGVFDERNREFAEIIAATAEATLDSVAQTERLRERTRELDRQTQRLDRINGLNRAIRRINRAVVDADSREAIVETVCDRLVDLEAIEFAWVGEPTPDAERLSLAAWAGPDRSYLDMRDLPVAETESDDPALTTARSRDVTYVPNIVRRSQAGEWQTAALQQGYRSVLSVPLAYDDSLYGVITVFAARQDLFDDAFRTMLTELGEVVGLGLNALDRRDALLGRRHTSIEFELDSTDIDDPLFSLTQELGCTVDISTILPRDDVSLVYAECTAVTEQQVRTTVTDLPEIKEVRRVSGTDPCESDPCLFEFLVTDTGLVSDLAQRGVHSQRVMLESDRGRIVAIAPLPVDIGTLVDDLEDRWPALELTRREIERETATTSSAFLMTTELTAAQQEAVEAAYEAGFFQWPRDSTSEEIATVLGISQPAFAQRLRAAESKIFDAYCRGVRRQSAGRLRSLPSTS